MSMSRSHPWVFDDIELEPISAADAEDLLNFIKSRKGNLFGNMQSLPLYAAQIFYYYTSTDDATVIKELIDLGVWRQLYSADFFNSVMSIIIQNKSHNVLTQLFKSNIFDNINAQYLYAIASKGQIPWAERLLLSLGYEYTGPAEVRHRICDTDGRIRSEIIKMLIKHGRHIPNHALLELYSYVHWPYAPRNQAGFGQRCLELFADYSKLYQKT